MAVKEKIEFETGYNSKRIKKEFFRKIVGKHETNQDQLANAKISVMAEKFGIDALISKAKQTTLNMNQQAELFGNDLTLLTRDRDKLLQTKENLRKTFERIPAIIRKQEFGDKVENFVEAYTSGDLEKLTKLNQFGMVSTEQLNNLKEYRENQKRTTEELKMKEFEEYAKKMNFVKKEEIKTNEQVENNAV